MSEMTKPNLMIPVSLWGEVKVAAYRRGCKPVELVIECLREKYTEGPKKERKQPLVKSGELVEVQSPASDRKVPEPVSEPLQKESVAWVGVPVDPSEVPMKKCHRCSNPFTLDKLTHLPIAGGKMKPFCDGCIEDIKNGHA